MPRDASHPPATPLERGRWRRRLGGNVNGGRIVGTFPGLADDQRFEGRDLAITTDSRDLLADVLTGTLGLAAADLAAIFPDHTRKSLGLLRS